MRNLKFFSAVLAGVLLLDGSETKAGLIGLTVHSTYNFPSVSSVHEEDGITTISPTASFFSIHDIVETVTDTQIILSNPLHDFYTFNKATFNGPVFDFVNSGTLINSVTINGATNVSPIVTLTSDGAGGQLVEVNLQGLYHPILFNVTLDVGTATVGTNGPVVPEPGSLTVLSLGLATMGAYGWMKRRNAKVAAQFRS